MNILKKLLLAIAIAPISFYLALFVFNIFYPYELITGYVVYILSFLIIEILLLWLISIFRRKDIQVDGRKKVDYKGIILIIVGFGLVYCIGTIIYFLSHMFGN